MELFDFNLLNDHLAYPDVATLLVSNTERNNASVSLSGLTRTMLILALTVAASYPTFR